MNLHRLGYWMLAAMIAATPAAGEEARVNVYNWSDYIAPDTIPKFEVETGINVTYDVYDGNEALEAKLPSGKSGYESSCRRLARSWRVRS
jgi:putrescine transport system substrate-binding protein